MLPLFWMVTADGQRKDFFQETQDSVTAEEAWEEAWEQSKIKFIINMNEKGYTIEQIADVTEKSREEVEAVLEKEK